MRDGAVSYTCELSKGHPNNGPWSWLESAPPPSAPSVSGIAEEFGLAIELPAALNALGEGWFEYGLVERSYALRRPADFELMVERWGHTAIASAQHDATGHPWDNRTSWVSVIGDKDEPSRTADLACRSYVPGAGSGT